MAMVEKMWMRAYVREMLGALLVYVVLLVLALTYARPMAPGLLRSALLVTPMVGFALMIWAMARHFHRVDEYARKFFLENTALAGAITIGVTFTYGFLENAGFERLSMFSVWFIACSAMAVVSIMRAWLHR